MSGTANTMGYLFPSDGGKMLFGKTRLHLGDVFQAGQAEKSARL
jgi:hypothetical protein